ncbi:hypothetical protein [Ruminococcus sp.]
MAAASFKYAAKVFSMEPVAIEPMSMTMLSTIASVRVLKCKRLVFCFM